MRFPLFPCSATVRSPTALLFIRLFFQNQISLLKWIFISFFSDYKEYNTDTTVKFLVMMQKEKLKKADLDGFHKVFKLQSPVSCSSMVGIPINVF